MLGEEKTVTIGGVAIGNSLPFVLIAGPCQIESMSHALEVAAALDEICSAALFGATTAGRLPAFGGFAGVCAFMISEAM